MTPSRAQTSRSTLSRTAQVLTWAAAVLGTAISVGPPGGGAEPSQGDLSREGVALLEPILGDAIAELTLDNLERATPLDGLNITGHYGDQRDSARQRWARPFRARIDYEHRYVCAVLCTDPPVLKVDITGDDSATATAEAFAKRHFVQWSDQTQLVAESHHASGLHLLKWANVLPSGAWTGAWCAVLASTADGGIRLFIQQKAIRTIDESDVGTTAEQATAVALKHVSAKLRGGLAAAVQEQRLVLSHPVAPGHGPLWEVIVCVTSAGEHPEHPTTAAEEVLVDGMTGKVLSRQRDEG